jgi:putative N6-adenine-specific DNA methylase
LKFFIVCPRGLEGPLHAEISQIIQRYTNHDHIAPTGLEDSDQILLEQAFKTVSLPPLTPKASGGIEVAGPMAMAMAINLYSRIASRVLIQLAHATYKKEDDVYKIVRGLVWEEWFSPEQTLRVDVTSHRSPLTSLNFVTLRVKDAICDRLREVKGARPSIDTATPDVRVVAHLDATHAAIYLDTSGEALFKRGWRDEKGAAPLKENLAAGILSLAGWNPSQPLFDPMCGSGTFLIEAAQIALAIPAGAIRAGLITPGKPSKEFEEVSAQEEKVPASKDVNTARNIPVNTSPTDKKSAWQSPVSVSSGQPIRDVAQAMKAQAEIKKAIPPVVPVRKVSVYKPTRVDLVSSIQGFGFLRLKPFLQSKEKHLWELICQIADAQMKARANFPLKIAGSDINEKMVAICKGNWQKAGLPGLPIVRQVDALVAKSPFGVDTGVMLFNPPYGERIELKGGRGGDEAQKTSRGARDPLPKNISNPEFIAFLEQFARHLKEDFGGWQVDVLTADMGLPGQLRMKESKRTPLFNGAIECRLFRFDIRAMNPSS